MVCVILVSGQAAAEPPAELLLVRLYDPYRLLPKAASARLREEAGRIFDRSGAAVRFVERGGPDAVPATVYPAFPDRWRVTPTALGVAVGEPGGPRSVFLSMEAATEALGGRRGLGVALGRVLAHELIHTVAPDCPHTRAGLMASRLTRRMLTAPGVSFDETAARHLREGVASFREAKRTDVEVSSGR